MSSGAKKTTERRRQRNKRAKNITMWMYYEYVCRVYKSQMTLTMLMERKRREVEPNKIIIIWWWWYTSCRFFFALPHCLFIFMSHPHLRSFSFSCSLFQCCCCCRCCHPRYAYYIYFIADILLFMMDMLNSQSVKQKEKKIVASSFVQKLICINIWLFRKSIFMRNIFTVVQSKVHSTRRHCVLKPALAITFHMIMVNIRTNEQKKKERKKVRTK